MMEYWLTNEYYPFLILSFRLRRTINPPDQYPKTHFSNIPAFQHSNWGEAPNWYYTFFTFTQVSKNEQLPPTGS
jgi:hypothetical protein